MRSDDSDMAERPTTQNTKGSTSSEQIRVVVWSSFDRLVSELRRLIDGSGYAWSVELSQDCTLVKAIGDSGAQLAILDVDASPIGASALIAEVRRYVSHITIVALSAKCDARFATSTLGAGAEGYVFKDRAFEELLNAIRAISQGDRYISPSIDRDSLRSCRMSSHSPEGIHQEIRDANVGNRSVHD